MSRFECSFLRAPPPDDRKIYAAVTTEAVYTVRTQAPPAGRGQALAANVASRPSPAGHDSNEAAASGWR